MPTHGTKDSFTKYYLKSEASFVAFEYTNPIGKCCVILYKKRAFVLYIFNGHFNCFFYTSETKSILQSGKLIHEYLSELRTRGEKVSQIISTVDDYRAIIQNDKDLLRSRCNQMKSAHSTLKCNTLGIS
mgnify:CR=1 FL=1